MTRCSIQECGGTVLTKGLCRPHYRRLLRHGNPSFGAALRPGGRGKNNCGAQRCPALRRLKLFLLYEKNPEKTISAVRDRRQRKKHAKKLFSIPYFGSELEQIYKEARKISASTNVKHEVDHIVPLNGKIVCGLHVPWNLRIIPKSVNVRRKRTWSWDLQDC